MQRSVIYGFTAPYAVDSRTSRVYGSDGIVSGFQSLPSAKLTVVDSNRASASFNTIVQQFPLPHVGPTSTIAPTAMRINPARNLLYVMSGDSNNRGDSDSGFGIEALLAVDPATGALASLRLNSQVNHFNDLGSPDLFAIPALDKLYAIGRKRSTSGAILVPPRHRFPRTLRRFRSRSASRRSRCRRCLRTPCWKSRRSMRHRSTSTLPGQFQVEGSTALTSTCPTRAAITSVRPGP